MESRKTKWKTKTKRSIGLEDTVPLVKQSNEYKTNVLFNDGSQQTFDQMGLDKETSEKVFSRSGDIECITVHVKEAFLK